MRVSLRTGCRDHKDYNYIEKLIQAIRESGLCFDEVWLATSYGIPALSRCKEEAKDMAWAAERFREAGISASMQVSRTVGHSEEALITHGGEGVSSEFGVITSIDGISEPGVFCWNSPAVQEYFCEELKIYSGFGPDIAWVDDDIRLRLLGKSQALCYCEHCIQLFNERHGYQYNRETLKMDFYSNLFVREQYVAFQTETLADFAEMISDAIHEVSTDTVMALQNGGNTMLAINAQKACLDRMYQVTGKAPAFRAGGGFYNDHQPKDMFVKAMTLNYMNARLPEYVTMRSCEIENLPFTAYGKSPECTCIEAAMYLAYGCNEASVTLMRPYESLDWHKRMFRRLVQYRPFYDAYTVHNQDTVNGGICVYQPTNSNYVVCDAEGMPFWNDTCIWEAADKMRWGLPFHTSQTGEVYYLSEKTFDFLTDEDVEFLLNQPVIAEEAFMLKFKESQYGKNFHCDTPESDLQFWYTNKGNKWVVYQEFADSFNFIDISYEYREKLRRALEEITGNALSAYVAAPEQMVIVPRVNRNGRTVSVMLLNVSMTDTEEYEVVVSNPTNTETFDLLDPYGQTISLPFEKRGEVYVAKLPPLRSWRTVAMLI